MITSPSIAAAPGWRFLLAHPAHLLAFGFGVGLLPGARGTVGTLLAFPLYWGTSPRLDTQWMLIVAAALFLAGLWICGKTGADLGVHDYRGIVWDEIAAFYLVLVLLPVDAKQQWLWQAFAFLLFRLFDIFKPQPVRYFDRAYQNGFGVMLDDVVAAFYTLLVLAGWKLVASS